jgi:hypothetical protein
VIEMTGHMQGTCLTPNYDAAFNSMKDKHGEKVAQVMRSLICLLDVSMTLLSMAPQLKDDEPTRSRVTALLARAFAGVSEAVGVAEDEGCAMVAAVFKDKEAIAATLMADRVGHA